MRLFSSRCLPRQIKQRELNILQRASGEAAQSCSRDTIVEDSDLGLTFLERVWRAHYTNRRYGWGLLPQDYRAFKMQRDRWAAGAVQIVKKHWRRFLAGASRLGVRLCSRVRRLKGIHESSCAVGRVNWNTAPRGSFASAHNLPP